MYVSGVLATQKSLTVKVVKNFSTTIAILAGQRSSDAAGARLMRKIKELSSEEVTFTGIGGPEMEEVGLIKNYIDVNMFLDKPLVPYKNFLQAHVHQRFHPIMAPLHYKNKLALQALKKNDFFGDISKLRPKAYITVGNSFFAKQFFPAVKDRYELNNVLTPPCIHYDSLIINQRQEMDMCYDYWLYTNPREPINWGNYRFPSTYVGSFGAARALEYLYKASSKGRQFVKDNTILLSKEYNTEITEGLLAEERARWREKNNLSEETTVFYGLPGNTEAEIKWAVPLICNTVKTFLNNYSQYASENFAVVITSYDQYDDLIQDEVRKQDWPCKLILARNEQEKYSALAGSDMGAIVNGDAVKEAAVYQLPVVVLNNTSFFQSYFTLLYNSFNSDINIAINGENYPECLGQAFPEKIAEYWGEWFEEPRRRFEIVKRFQEVVLKLIPETTAQVVEEKVDSKAIAEPKIPFNKYENSEHLAAKKVLEAVKAYENVLASEPKYYELKGKREEMLNAFF